MVAPDAVSENALVLVDVQHDFLPGGALAIKGGFEVIQVCNEARSTVHFDLVALSQDTHTPGHCSFATSHAGHESAKTFSEIAIPTPSGILTLEPRQVRVVQQMLWPEHCIQGSRGWQFHASLMRAPNDLVVPKGLSVEIDSYSAFGDEFHGQFETTALNWALTSKMIKRVVVMGLALDYCVKFTCLDAARLGFEVWVVLDGCRAVDASPETLALTLQRLREAGVNIVQSVADLPTALFPRKEWRASVHG